MCIYRTYKCQRRKVLLFYSFFCKSAKRFFSPLSPSVMTCPHNGGQSTATLPGGDVFALLIGIQLGYHNK